MDHDFDLTAYGDDCLAEEAAFCRMQIGFYTGFGTCGADDAMLHYRTYLREIEHEIARRNA